MLSNVKVFRNFSCIQRKESPITRLFREQRSYLSNQEEIHHVVLKWGCTVGSDLNVYMFNLIDVSLYPPGQLFMCTVVKSFCV